MERILELTSRSSSDFSSKIRLQLKYDDGKLFVMIRHASNLVRKKSFPFIRTGISSSHRRMDMNQDLIVNVIYSQMRIKQQNAREKSSIHAIRVFMIQ